MHYMSCETCTCKTGILSVIDECQWKWVVDWRYMFTGASTSAAGGRGRDTREWSRPGFVARQTTLSTPKTLRVSLRFAAGFTKTFQKNYVKTRSSCCTILQTVESFQLLSLTSGMHCSGLSPLECHCSLVSFWIVYISCQCCFSETFEICLSNRFRLRNDLYCVEWGVKLYSLTHSLTHWLTVKPIVPNCWVRSGILSMSLNWSGIFGQIICVMRLLRLTVLGVS